jgi:hypothetical protein
MHRENKKYMKEFDGKYYDTDFLQLRCVQYGERMRNELSESDVWIKRFGGSETQDYIETAKVTSIIIDCSLRLRDFLLNPLAYTAACEAV